MTCATARVVLVGPQFLCFLPSAIIYPLPQAPKGPENSRRFFCFGEPAEGFGSLYLYVSMYCFLTCLGYIILGARRGNFSYALGVFDFSHEEVKRAVDLHL